MGPDEGAVGVMEEVAVVEGSLAIESVPVAPADGAVIGHSPVPVPGGIGLEIDALGQRALSRVVFIGDMHNNAYYGKSQEGNVRR